MTKTNQNMRRVVFNRGSIPAWVSRASDLSSSSFSRRNRSISCKCDAFSSASALWWDFSIVLNPWSYISCYRTNQNNNECYSYSVALHLRYFTINITQKIIANVNVDVYTARYCTVPLMRSVHWALLTDSSWAEDQTGHCWVSLTLSEI